MKRWNEEIDKKSNSPFFVAFRVNPQRRGMSLIRHSGDCWRPLSTRNAFVGSLHRSSLFHLGKKTQNTVSEKQTTGLYFPYSFVTSYLPANPWFRRHRIRSTDKCTNCRRTKDLFTIDVSTQPIRKNRYWSSMTGSKRDSDYPAEETGLCMHVWIGSVCHEQIWLIEQDG